MCLFGIIFKVNIIKCVDKSLYFNLILFNYKGLSLSL